MKFNKFNLSENILKSLKDLEYINATKVQEKVIPEMLLNKDIIAKAQTGTGKTAAFVIPLCEKIKWEDIYFYNLRTNRVGFTCCKKNILPSV